MKDGRNCSKNVEPQNNLNKRIVKRGFSSLAVEFNNDATYGLRGDFAFNKRFLFLAFLVILVFAARVSAAKQVKVEFIYWDPSTDKDYCSYCPSWQAPYQEFLKKNATVVNIAMDYGEKVVVTWIPYFSGLGYEKRLEYKIAHTNVLAIDGKTIIRQDFNETFIRAVIDAYLYGTPLPGDSPSQSLFAGVAAAFSFGFFETFSPCLLVLLSFVLSYSIGESKRFRDGMLRVTTFGVGFVVAAFSLGLVVGLLSLYLIRAFTYAMLLVVCIFSLFFGLNQVGLLKTTAIETKSVVKRLSERFAFTYGGLLLLGFLFYFLDPCIAPMFFLTVPLFAGNFLALMLLVFCVGVMIPFFVIGVLAGSISKLVRSAYRHKSKIRAVSGLILIGYAVYLVIFYLIPI